MQSLQVAAMTSLGQLAVLSEQLSLQCSSAVLACLDAWPQHVAQVRVQGKLVLVMLYQTQVHHIQ